MFEMFLHKKVLSNHNRLLNAVKLALNFFQKGAAPFYFDNDTSRASLTPDKPRPVSPQQHALYIFRVAFKSTITVV